MSERPENAVKNVYLDRFAPTPSAALMWTVYDFNDTRHEFLFTVSIPSIPEIHPL